MYSVIYINSQNLSLIKLYHVIYINSQNLSLIQNVQRYLYK